LGETGQPLYEILKEAYPNTLGIDAIHTPMSKIIPEKMDVINICIPYSDNFQAIVKDYTDLFNPDLIIIHSTVPIGTTATIENAVHSPIMGKHDNMKESILKFKKWIGGRDAYQAMKYMGYAGIQCVCVATSQETEALKLICLAKYGMSIAFAQYAKTICKQLKFGYADVIQWDINYNSGVNWMLKRPILHPPGRKIGGHCVTQNTKILNEQYPNQILEEILKYE
jgi:UDP-N-acetyl-D-mannosaminuronate dehydrogenase